jgi:hypothetical protein
MQKFGAAVGAPASSAVAEEDPMAFHYLPAGSSMQKFGTAL